MFGLDVQESYKWAVVDKKNEIRLFRDKPVLKNNMYHGDNMSIIDVFDLKDIEPDPLILYSIEEGMLFESTYEEGKFYEFCDSPDFEEDEVTFGFLKDVESSVSGREYITHADEVFRYIRNPQYIKVQE